MDRVGESRKGKKEREGEQEVDKKGWENSWLCGEGSAGGNLKVICLCPAVPAELVCCENKAGDITNLGKMRMKLCLNSD